MALDYDYLFKILVIGDSGSFLLSLLCDVAMVMLFVAHSPLKQDVARAACSAALWYGVFCWLSAM